MEQRRLAVAEPADRNDDLSVDGCERNEEGPSIKEIVHSTLARILPTAWQMEKRLESVNAMPKAVHENLHLLGRHRLRRKPRRDSIRFDSHSVCREPIDAFRILGGGR